MPSLHPKTPRRVMILLLGACLIIGAGAAVYFVRQNQIERELRAIRAEGIAALERGDYPAALTSLKRYVARHRDDADALFAYGVARARVEDANSDRHIKQPIEIFRTVLKIEPNNLAAQHMLLEMYVDGFFNEEAIELADTLLESDPDRPATLKGKAIVLQRLERWQQAAEVYEHLNEVTPTDLQAQLQTLGIYRHLDKPADEVLARAQAMHAEHPDDPRFDLLLAITVGDNGEMSKAVAMLRRLAASATPPDAEFVRVLSSILERNGMIDASDGLLNRVAADSNDPEILAIYAQRQWQNGAFTQLANRLKRIDPADPASDSDLLAYRALALMELKRHAAAKPILDALAARSNDSEALCWAAAMRTRFADPEIEGRAAIEQYRTAIVRDPGNAVVRFYLGEAYERLGEHEPAIQAYERAAELAPTWSRPHGKIARAYAATGRMDEAIAHARAALATAPNDLYAKVTDAVVTYLAQGSESAEGADLLDRVAEIQRRQPLEPETLPIYVALLSRSGQRAQAVDIIRQVLDSPTTAPTSAPTAAPRGQLNQTAMLRLVSVSRSERLGMEQALLERLERADANRSTPSLALAQATLLAEQGRPLDGLALLQEAARDATAAPATATSPAPPPQSVTLQWRLAIAEYREYIDDPGAAADWAALGEAYPGDLQVQTSILKLGDSVRSDRGFIDRTINRVLTLTGQEGTLWRVERARWLLGSNQQKDLSEAVRILNDIVSTSPSLIEPRLLLASALEKVGNLSQAIRELQTAIEQQPNRPAVVLELARLEQGVGRFDDALQRLDRLTRSAESLAPETVRRVAALLERQGEFVRALTLLETIYPPSTTIPSDGTTPAARETAGRLLLARLYHRLGQFADAQAIYEQLLAYSSPDPEAIHAAADFYARRGNFTTAQAALARLSQSQLQPGIRELILADFNDKYGPTEDAAGEYYQAATRAAPGDVNTWREYAAFLLRNGRWQAALDAVRQGLQALPTDQRLRTLEAHISAIAHAGAGDSGDGQPGAADDFNRLIQALARDPENPQTLQIIQLVRQARSGVVAPDEVTSGLRALLNDHPRNKIVHLELVRRYRALGRLDDAADAAIRAMKFLPQDPAAAEVAVNILRQTDRLAALEDAARQWRLRTLDNPLPADLVIAEALLQQGHPQEALDALSHANHSADEPNNDLLAMRARALIAAGRADEARRLLSPHLSESHTWRRMWLELASTVLSDPATASAWIEEVENQMPADAAADERLMLAAAWQSVGVGFDLPPAQDKARKILLPLSHQDDAPAATWSLLAALDDSAGDTASAEQNYRRAVEADADDPNHLNNLAYFLLSNRDSEEANVESIELARQAIKMRPNEPSFHDTLARSMMNSGNYDDALAHFQRAIDLNPRSLDALIGKARALLELERTSLATSVIQQIDKILVRAASQPTHIQRSVLTPTLRSELDLIRAGLNVTTSAR